jgi:hypothetical protein
VGIVLSLFFTDLANGWEPRAAWNRDLEAVSEMEAKGRAFRSLSNAASSRPSTLSYPLFHRSLRNQDFTDAAAVSDAAVASEWLWELLLPLQSPWVLGTARLGRNPGT